MHGRLDLAARRGRSRGRPRARQRPAASVRQLAPERPGAGQPLDRRGERLEGRDRAPPARRRASPASWPPRHSGWPARCGSRDRVEHGSDARASAAASRSPAAGQRATISSSGSRRAVRERGPDRLGHERHDRMEQPQVRVERLDERPPRRLALLGRQRRRRRGGPWRARGPSRRTRSRSRRRGRA